MNCDPNSLLGAANCFRCIPPARQRATAIYLLCRWANGEQPEPPPVVHCFPPECAVNYPDSIDISGAGDPNFNGNYPFLFLDGGGNPVYTLGGAPFGTSCQIFFDGLNWILDDSVSVTGYISVPESVGSPFVWMANPARPAVDPGPYGSPNYPVTPGCDPVVRAWLGNILLDPTAVAPPQDVIDAVCELVQDLRDGAILDKLLVVNPVIPPTDGTAGSVTAMMYPLLWNAGNTFIPFTNFNFTIAALNLNGLVGDRNLGPFADVGFHPAIHWGIPDSGGISLYETEPNQAPLPNAGENGEMDVGCIDASLTQYFCLQVYNVWNPFTLHSGYEALCWDPVLAQGYMWNTRADIPAFYTFNRTSVTLSELYYANSANPTFVPFGFIDSTLGDVSADIVPDTTTLWYAFEWPVIGSFPSSKRFSFIAIHEGLDHNEQQTFFNAVQTFRITLGGGWV